tara:strand:- start:3521 stop:4027 length:507 start_codon:yes stop_codon:yes gene_type:complete
MPQFADKTGRVFDCSISFGIARTLKNRDENPIDLLDPDDLSRVLSDPYERFDLLFSIIESQAKAAELDADAFGLRVATRQCYIDAHAALTEALSDFFHMMDRPDLAAVIELAIESTGKLQQLAVDKIRGPETRAKIDAEISRVNQELDAAMKDSTPGSESTAGPLSAE